MLEAAGRDLSRQSLVRTLTSGRPFASNVFPAVSYDGSIRSAPVSEVNIA